MKPQFIKTEGGGELVVLPRSAYEELVARASIDLDEDAAIARIVDRSNAALASGRDIVLPAEVAEAIIDGQNPIKVVREWRGLTQAQLARRNKLTQGYVSQLEAGTSGGSPKALKAIAKTLKVPVDLLLPD
jgi:DNA-binding XRE family transcriptional regulator